MTNHQQSSYNISSLPKNLCYGCGVCVNSCPVNCIKMKTDHEGFLYPQVDEAICIQCKKCIITCPGFNDIEHDQRLDTPVFYGGIINSDKIRYASSSGGVFSLVANHVISLHGAVYGAVYDFQNLRVTHARATNEEQLSLMRKSKYVQSDSTGIFPEVKEDLLAGTMVLFTGTPCQVAGLKLFLDEDYQNLITCDIICHGVPSPGLFNSHFSWVEEKQSGKIKNIDFRTKEKGWGSFLNFFLKTETASDSQLTYAPLDAYYALFLANLSLRPVCYVCKYASTHRESDLTIGDFWRVEKKYPELFDGKGTSLILANTIKGDGLIRSLRQTGRIEALNALNPLPPNLVRPTSRPRFRDRFFKQISLAHWSKYRIKMHMIAILILIKTKLLQGLKKLLGIDLESNL